MIEYKIINGIRYYRLNSSDRWKIDNLSEQEANRLRADYTTPSNCNSSSYNASTNTNIGKSSFWYWSLFIIISLIIIAAIIYGQSNISTDELFINHYMKSADTSEFIIPNSDSRYLTENDIADLSAEQIQLAINEIYARHGRAFHSEKNLRYFSNCSWYNPDESKSDEEIEKEFNSIENSNLNLLVQILNKEEDENE